MTPLAAEYKRILEENGWTFEGECNICNGTAWEYRLGDRAVIKVRKESDKFTIRGRRLPRFAPMTIKGLLPTLEKYGLSTKQSA